MDDFDAVIFDWMLTLTHYPSTTEHIVTAMKQLGRPVDSGLVEHLVAELEKVAVASDVKAAMAVGDISADAHLKCEMLAYSAAGIDPALAESMYQLLGTPAFHQPYPESSGVLSELHARGVRIGVVSDIHVDLRPHAELFGFGASIDAWSLSFELGFQKPDLRIFQDALDQLGCEANRALMVGDRASHDGAAVELGMTCLILPAPDRVGNPGLRRVLRVAAGSGP